MFGNQQIAYRAETEGKSAPAQQEFDSPQAELEWLKENRQDLKGFVRVLEIIDDVQKSPHPFIEIRQSSGRLSKRWLVHDAYCSACAGVLLCWFFRNIPFVDVGEWDFGGGVAALSEHLGLRSPLDLHRLDYYLQTEIGELLDGIIRDLGGEWEAGIEASEGATAFGNRKWPVPHLDVFRKLAEMYPDK